MTGESHVKDRYFGNGKFGLNLTRGVVTSRWLNSRVVSSPDGLILELYQVGIFWSVLVYISW